MTDHDALRLDTLLDQLDAFVPVGMEPLVQTAAMLQSLDDRQRGTPSSDFRARLRQRLFVSAHAHDRYFEPDEIVTLVPTRAQRDRSAAGRPVPRSWLAIAAALLLLVGGAAAVAFGSFGPNSDREPSAIPAVSFATPTTPETATSNVVWTVPGPEGAGTESGAHLIAGGRIFRSFLGGTTEQRIQAVDAETGAILWDEHLDIGGRVLAAYSDLVLVAGQLGLYIASEPQLIALEAATGNEVWRAPLSEPPVAMTVVGDRALVLSQDNNLDAIDLTTGESRYVADIGGESTPLDQVSSPMPPLASNDRLAVIDDTLVAVLADGSLAGIDIETGASKLWLLRQEPGRVTVYAVDGLLVAVDSGDLDAIGASMTESENASTGFMVPAMASPVSASCLDPGYPITADAMTDDHDVAPLATNFWGLDPESGDPVWFSSSSEAALPLYPRYTGLVYVTSTTNEWPTDREQIAVCEIDAATGHAWRIDHLGDLGNQIFRLVFTDEPDLYAIGIVLDGGQFLAVPAVLDPTVSGPVIALDPKQDGGIRWIEAADGALYLSMQNQDLMKLEVPES
jgi:outer membrane protein assembly factor BamB